MNPIKVLLLVFILAISANADAHQPYGDIRHGAGGLRPISFFALNRGDREIECGASLAHWRSLDLGAAEPGEAVSATIWVEPNSGVAYLLSETGRRMPLEALWCGLKRRAWATRATITLPNRIGEPPSEIAVTCAFVDARLRCE